MDWIYLSPHLDDAVLSLGGLIWEQTQVGLEVCIWTICAGDPPPGEFSPFAESLHQRWEVGREAIAQRRAEDIEACTRLGAGYRHLDIPDCIYRRSPRTGDHLYASESALWVPIHPDEESLVEVIGSRLREMLPSNANLVSPLTLGNHVDHRLTRAAAERLDIPLHYYSDYPYVLDTDVSQSTLNLESEVTTITASGMCAWQEAIGFHRSQISTFWDSLEEMKNAIQSYYDQMRGIQIWR